MKTNSLCSDDSLRLLLREDEQSDDYRDAARHVDSCPHCQQRIGELAAEDDEWHEAHEMLLAGDESGSGNIDAVSAHERSRRRWQRRPTAWTEAMARQLLSPPSHPEMLGRIGRYEVERLIGTGGMGVVFKAFDSELNRPVAVKLLSPYLAGSGAARKRFAREARAAAAVVHEHVVAIHNVETDGEVPFLVMQYVPGESLQGRLDREGPLGICEVLRIGMQTASGLAAAHAQGLVHRDVKPSNVLLEKGVERSLLTDFGLARAGDDAGLTLAGHHPGTPQYMSPEQARGEALDGRSDLFSLGCVLYEMATGVSPFRTDSTMATLRRIVDEQPAAMASLVPELPPWFSHIVERLLSKDPAQRFASASEVSQLLEQCLSHLQQPTSVALPSSLPRQKSVSVSRRRKTFFIGVLVMIASLALGLVAMFAWQGGLSPEVADESLEGVWELVLPPDIAAKRPENERLRLVIVGDWQGRFQGDQRLSASRLKVEPQHTPKRLSFVGADGQPMRGIYEVKEDGLRLNIAPDTDALPKKFGAERPEFKRVTGKLAKEQIAALKQFSQKAAPKQATVGATDADALQGVWTATAAFWNGQPVPNEQLPNIKVVFSGEKMTFFPPEGDSKPVLEFTFSVDSNMQPKAITVTRLEGGLAQKSGPGIYAFDGDTLKLCLSIRKGKEPPTEFAAPENSGLILLTLKKNVVAEIADTAYARPTAKDQEATAMIPAEAWGKPVNGLRVAIVLRSPPIDKDDRLCYEIVAENVSDRDIRFAATLGVDDWHNYCKTKLADADGKQVEQQEGTLHRLRPRLLRIWLKPRERSVISSWATGLLKQDEAGLPLAKPEGSVGPWSFSVKPGRYSVSAAVELGPSMYSTDPVSKKRTELSPAKGEWSGKLQTGAVPVVLFTQPAPEDEAAAKPTLKELRWTASVGRRELLVSERDKQTHPPIEFRIAVSKADRETDEVAWFPIIEPRTPAPAGKSGANLPIEEKLKEKWHGLLSNKVEHTLIADGSWRVVKCDVAQSAQSTDLVPSFEIRITLDAVGGALLRRLVSTHLNQPLAIVVDGTIVAAPVLRSEFGLDIVISGNFSKETAEKLAAAIRKPDLRKTVSFLLRFVDVTSAVADMKAEAAGRKIRGFDATIDPRLNAVAITADADTLEALREILTRLDSDDEALVFPAENPSKNPISTVIELADLGPQHDGKEVTMIFKITDTQLIGGEREGAFPHVKLHYEGMKQPPYLGVYVKGELADVLHRSACVAPDDKLVGRSIKATGTIKIHTDFPKGEDQTPVYQLDLRDWKKFQILPEPKTKSKLEGVWIAEKVTSAGEVVPPEKFPFELHFEKDQLIFRFVAPSLGKDRVHEIVVDETKTPATIDITREVKGQKETVYGIYKFEGDRLLICSLRDNNRQPSKERPTTFDSSNEVQSDLLVLTRKPGPQE